MTNAAIVPRSTGVGQIPELSIITSARLWMRHAPVSVTIPAGYLFWWKDALGAWSWRADEGLVTAEGGVPADNNFVLPRERIGALILAGAGQYNMAAYKRDFDEFHGGTLAYVNDWAAPAGLKFACNDWSKEEAYWDNSGDITHTLRWQRPAG
jgi:hypothetical protein